jgi:lipoate-protein ligase A
MSSEVETSLNSSGIRNSERFLDSARNDKGAGATSQLFDSLIVYHDESSRTAAINMAADEALLESAIAPTIRFYGWDHPALSFGYFGRYADVAQHKRDLVRRWTGGGIVFHGEDLTYSIVVPAGDSAFLESSMSIYEKVHQALSDALTASGQHAVLAAIDDRGGRGAATRASSIDGVYNCFANPVRADVLLNERKIAGAAQRRTRRGLLHQGSIQNVVLGNGLTEWFAQALSKKTERREINKEVLARAEEIAKDKYGSDSWLRKR